MNTNQRHFLKDLVYKNTVERYLAVKHAAEDGRLDILKYFIEKGAIIDGEIVRYAEKNGHLEVVKFLEILKFLENEGLSRLESLNVCNKIETGELKFPI
jgi:hypothetical protein